MGFVFHTDKSKIDLLIVVAINPFQVGALFFYECSYNAFAVLLYLLVCSQRTNLCWRSLVFFERINLSADHKIIIVNCRWDHKHNPHPWLSVKPREQIKVMIELIIVQNSMPFIRCAAFYWFCHELHAWLINCWLFCCIC